MDFNAVLNDLKRERNSIDKAIKALEEVVGNSSGVRYSRSQDKVVPRKRKPMSAATKRKLKAAAKARWKAATKK